MFDVVLKNIGDFSFVIKEYHKIPTAKADDDDDIRHVCPLPNVLIDMETLLGERETKSRCVNTRVANRLVQQLGWAYRPTLPSAVGAAVGPAGDLATQLMLTAAKMAGAKAGGLTAGWALSALGFTTGVGNTNQVLGQISGELQGINQTLVEMNQQIANFTAATRAQTCNDSIDASNNARSLIDGLADDYQDFLTTASEAKVIPPLTNCLIPGSAFCVEDWANAVLDNSSTTTGIMNALFKINNSMTSLSSIDGVIATCLDPNVLPLPVGGEDDQNYYASVSSLMNAFYNYQARGLILLVEAYQFNAWKATGEQGGDPVTDPFIADDLCLTPPNSMVALACQKTVSSVAAVHQNLVRQFTMGGVGYSDEDVYIHYRHDSPIPLIFVRSLEDFTAEAYQQGTGESCSSPLSSNAPCGITVGNPSPGGEFFFDVTYEYQDEWRPVSSVEFADILRFSIGQTPATFLEVVGLKNPQDKLIFHHDFFANKMAAPDFKTFNQDVTCFADLDIPQTPLSIQPVCEPTSFRNYWDLKRQGVESWFEQNPNIPTLGTRNGFYDFTTNINRNAWHFVSYPGWSPLMYQSPNAQQFRWPVIAADRISCTKGRSATNVAGAYTRCADDLDIWLTQHVPGPTVNNGRQPTYHYIGEQPWSTFVPGWADLTGEQLTDGVIPAIDGDRESDEWVAFKFSGTGIPQPSVAFDFGSETDIGLISVTYYDKSGNDKGGNLGPDRVEIFVSNDGGVTYPTDPVAVYTDFERDSQDPNVGTYTAFISVNIKNATAIRMDFYQGETTPDTLSRTVFLAEVNFYE